MISPKRVWSSLADRLALLRSVRGPGEAVLLVRAVVVALAVPLLLRLPLSWVARVLEPRRARDERHEIDRIVAVVDQALRLGRPLVREHCLTRGATLYHLLRRAGYEVDLRFGVGRVDQEIVGHCWLSRDGEPLFEKTDPRLTFTETYIVGPGSVP